ncbi:MAG: enoyl-CoA hydratase, partial [Actinomyces sp.]
MSDTVTTTITDDGVAVVRLDDGKANALGPTVITDLHAALDRAEADAGAVVLIGR